MNKENKLKRIELHNSLYIFAIITAIVFIVVLLQSCSSERKALKPYKAVNSDVDTSFQAKKKELISRVCAANFPIEVKTIIKDSIYTKLVKVQDKTEINRLKYLLAQKCKEVNIDSIYNALPLDTIYIYNTKTKQVTIKDTIANYQLSKQISILQNDLNKTNAAILIEQSKVNIANDKVDRFKALRNYWRVRFFVLLICVITFVGLKILDKYRTLPFKL